MATAAGRYDGFLPDPFIVKMVKENVTKKRQTKVPVELAALKRLVLINRWLVPLKTGVIINEGPVWELNPGPLAPKARIIPLDQQATCG